MGLQCRPLNGRGSEWCPSPYPSQLLIRRGAYSVRGKMGQSEDHQFLKVRFFPPYLAVSLCSQLFGSGVRALTTCAIMSKEPSDAVLEDISGNVDVLDDADPATSEKRGTEFDTRDMNRMGKLPQLRVSFLFAL